MANQRQPGVDGAISVMHLTESLGGGVVTSLSRLASRQAEAGMLVSVYFTRRPDTPTMESLREWFGPKVSLFEADLSRFPLFGRERWIISTARHGADGDFDIIHFHSSMGGAFGRLALLWHKQPPSFYSPHGFSFLRTDYSAPLRLAFRVVEFVLGKITRSKLVLVSPSEAGIATRSIMTSTCFVLPNGVQIEKLPVRDPDAHNELPVVAMMGRIAFQKAPDKFAAVAEHFRGRAKFLWIGGGDDPEFNALLNDAGVVKTGWLPYAEALAILSSIDVLLFLTLWEGMPLAAMEAQAMGIPVIASEIVGNIDVVEDGRTGFLVDSVPAAIEALGRLLDEPGLAAEFTRRSFEIREERWSDAQLGERSHDLYTGRLKPYSS